MKVMNYIRLHESEHKDLYIYNRDITKTKGSRDKHHPKYKLVISTYN